MSDTLDKYISVGRQFLRSVNIEADIGRLEALKGYICQDTALGLIKNMAHQINYSGQRAFTWTGPYGGGKSSLALVLASLVSPNKTISNEAAKLIGHVDDDDIEKAWKKSKNGWLVLPVVGKRTNVVTSISNTLNKALGNQIKIQNSTDLILKLIDEAESRKNDGVILILDELGKFLESAAQNNEDIYFYQELADAANRCKGKLIVVGILHQSFEQYAIKLGRDARDEWAKVQGRYIDIPLIVGSDEVIELVGQAIEKKNLPPLGRVQKFAEAVSEVISHRRAHSPPNLAKSLVNCWPLHPVTAALLGPISRKKFSQNERSVFGFLTSVEPLGFTSFIRSTNIDELALYGPARYWDYLKTNLEQSIVSSSDGHRWAASNDAIERAEARDGSSEIHIKLTKTIALIEMFKGGSGLNAEDKILEISIENATQNQIRAALQDLARWSIIIFRKHLGSWAIYSGSDFDIDASVSQARSELGELDIKRLIELAELNPIVAKRHYHETGTLRWFNRSLVNLNESEGYIKDLSFSNGAIGEFILVIPDKQRGQKQVLSEIKIISKNESPNPFLIGHITNSEKINELGIELMALERVQKTNRTLESDSVAKKEINSRISAIKTELSEELKVSFETAEWFHHGEQINKKNGINLSVLASNIADQTYPQTLFIHNELVNKEVISGNATRARKDLMYRMVSRNGEPRLGYEGFSADASLFASIIEPNDLYVWEDGKYVFTTSNKKSSLYEYWAPLWTIADNLFRKSEEAVSLDRLHEQWKAPPIGVRSGLLPILSLIYFLANRHELGLYIQNTFIPELNDAYLDEWLHDTKRVSFKYVQIGAKREKFLLHLSKSLSKYLGKPVSANPLESARGLVNLIVNLPGWTKRTSSISSEAQELKRMVLKANDPYKVLFTDLPNILEINDEVGLVEKITSLTAELQNAYPTLITRFKGILFKGLDHDGPISRINERANSIKAISGDFQMDAFIARLSVFKDDTESLEGLLSVAINKNPRDWVDRDMDSAILALGEMCTKFRKIESLSSLRGKNSNRKAFAFIYTDPKESFTSDNFDISFERLPIINKYSKDVLELINSQNLSKDEALAVFAEACNKLIKS